MIGFKEDKKIQMEEIKVDSNDILAIEGTVRGCKVRIILIYMDNDKTSWPSARLGFQPPQTL